MSPVDLFEALRAYARRGRTPLGECTECDAVLDADATGPVAHPTTNPSIYECAIALCGLATGCLGSDFIQQLPIVEP